jgi:putative redox protein
MKSEVSVNYINNMAFEANVNGHKLILDANEESGGENLGPRPKPLLLAALGGCSGMDVVSILKKMQVSFDSFNISVSGITADEHPKKYIEMTVVYEFKGSDVPYDKVKKAVDLSIEKYCGVNAVFKDAVKMNYEIVINGQKY